jgi:hypothetical protein
VVTSRARFGAVAAVGVLAAVTGVLLLSSFGGAFADSSDPSEDLTPGAAYDASAEAADTGPQSPLAGDLPPLTASEAASAQSIAFANDAVNAIVSGRAVTVTSVPWVTSTRRSIGAGLEITWTQPISVSANWPLMAYDETETRWPPYQKTTGRVDISDLTGIHVAVNLTTSKVIGIEPLPGAGTVNSVTLDPNYSNTLPPQPQDPH